MGRLDGKVAVVTGNTSGIGNATAWLLAREGAKVVMGARRAERGEKMEKEMRAEGLEAMYVKTDVMVKDECKNLIRKAVDTYGRIDILANVAGINGGTRYKLHEADEEMRDRLFKTDLYGIIDLCSEAIPHMLKQKSGSIINVASVAGIVACPYDSLYSAVKGAVKMLSIGMAYDYAKDGIRVNCVCPGLTKTEMGAKPTADTSAGTPVGASGDTPRDSSGGDAKDAADDNPNDGHGDVGFADRILANLPAGRFAQPSEIAQGILFLASDDASFANGTVLTLDGGEIIS